MYIVLLYCNVIERKENLTYVIDEYTTTLMTQASSCPFQLSDLEIMDKRLKEFVHLHHLDLLRAVKYRVTKLKDNIQEKQLYKQLSYYYLTKEQV